MILLYLFIFLIIVLKFGSVHPELESDQVYKKIKKGKNSGTQSKTRS